MKYLLDTNICVYFLNKNSTVINRLQPIPDEDIAVSIISIAELKFGAYNSHKIENNLEKIEHFKNIIQPIGVTSDIADKFGQIKTYLRTHGMIVDDFDILIGATAITFHLTLITNNTRHFINMPAIVLDDWSKERE
jgi:tRNA(fMet)-specific endonuclease VapC